MVVHEKCQGRTANPHQQMKTSVEKLNVCEHPDVQRPAVSAPMLIIWN